MQTMPRTRPARLKGRSRMPELMILGAVVVLVAGSSQIPKLARALGSARKEFEQAAAAHEAADAPTAAPDETPSGRHFS